MTVYIEYFLAYNLALDLLICIFTLRVMRLSANPWRILLSVAAGTAAAFLYPFLRVHAVLMLFIKAGAAGSMVFLLYPFRNARKYFLTVVSFLFITFLFGGAAYAVTELPYQFVPTGAQNSVSAAVAVLCGAAFVGYFTFSFIKYLNKIRDSAGYMKKVEAFAGGSRVKFTAFLDTGNGLYSGGLPILPVSRPVFHRLFGKSDEKGRYISLSTAAGNGKMLVMKPDKILIYSDKGANTIYDVIIGLYEGLLSKTGEYDGLLHPALISEADKRYVVLSHVHTPK